METQRKDVKNLLYSRRLLMIVLVKNDAKPEASEVTEVKESNSDHDL